MEKKITPLQISGLLFGKILEEFSGFSTDGNSNGVPS